ncbi:hypothetical protein AB0K09_25050, partial [Streptomyces sp. NPDC049577]|uniref:hypothetical protein n=1 Tax=Streptomyces sp. NPDC049577 TaxID=3155153 RepID=UPI00343362A9
MTEARFCMTCGKERPPAGGAVPPPPPPAPPSYAPGAGAALSPAVPSPAALFLRRAFTGDWAGAAKAVLWPAVPLFVLALVVSLASDGDYDDIHFASWSERFQAALGLLLQGLGAGLEVETRRNGGLLTSFVQGSGSISVWPLTITVLWAFAVAVGARRLRRSQGTGGGAEAALRIALLAGAVVLALGLYGQPDADLVSIDTTPVLAALFTFALSGAVSAAVLCRDALAVRLGAGALMAVRAWGTALRALGLSVGLCGLIVFVVIASHQHEAGGGGAVAASLLFLANLGLMGLGLSWGAGVEGSASDGGRPEGGTFGLSELGDAAGSSGGWAQAGALAVGALCAVVLAVLAARRSADRREQALAGAFFLGALLLLSCVSGAEMNMSAGSAFASRSHEMHASVGTNGGELLLFGLVWTAGAVLLATLLGRTSLASPRPASPVPAHGFPPAPGMPPVAPATPPAWPATPAPVPPAPA